jgi:hypothetical protein
MKSVMMMKEVSLVMVCSFILIGCGSNEKKSEALKQSICTNINEISQLADDKKIFSGTSVNTDFADFLTGIRLDFENLSNLNVDNQSIRDARSSFNNYEDTFEKISKTLKDGDFLTGLELSLTGAKRINELKSWCTATLKN